MPIALALHGVIFIPEHSENELSSLMRTVCDNVSRARIVQKYAANPTVNLKRQLEGVIGCARNAKACEERVCGTGVWQKREDLGFRSCLSGI